MKRYKVLVIEPNKRHVWYWLTHGAKNGLQDLGCIVCLFNIKDSPGDERVNALRGAIDEFKPDFLFTINNVGLIPDLLCKYRIPVVCWFSLAEPRILKYGLFPPEDFYFMFVCDKRNIDFFRVKGYKNLFHLPLTTQFTEFELNRELSEDSLHEMKCDISFAGSISHDARYLKYRKYLDKTLGEGVPDEVISIQAGDINRSTVDIIREIYLRRGKGDIKETEWLYNYIENNYEMELLCIRLAGLARYRQEIIKALMDWKVHLYGGSELLRLGEGFVYKGFIKRTEVPKLYRASRINLNISLFMSGFNVSFFDIIASGGFVITNFRDELENLFKVGEEVVCFKDIEDLKEKVEFFLKNKGLRKEIVSKAQKRFLANHTYRERMRTILATMQVYL
jgi:spore maturation protein CgeB